MNVSSIVVKTIPKHLKEVIDSINSYDLCEIHFKDADGRIVITIEGNSIREQIERMSVIQKTPKVLSVNFMFSYYE